MTIERVRDICLKLPQATEQIQWGNDLVFKIGGKMFAAAALEAAGNALSFKCSPEEFALLTEREGIIPAPYLARAHWVGLTKFDIMTLKELERRLRESYDLVVSGLPKKVQAAIQSGSGRSAATAPARRRSAARQ